MHNTTPGRSIIYLSPRKRHIYTCSDPAPALSALSFLLPEGAVPVGGVSSGLKIFLPNPALSHGAPKVKPFSLVLPQKLVIASWFGMGVLLKQC